MNVSTSSRISWSFKISPSFEALMSKSRNASRGFSKDKKRFKIKIYFLEYDVLLNTNFICLRGNITQGFLSENYWDVFRTQYIISYKKIIIMFANNSCLNQMPIILKEVKYM